MWNQEGAILIVLVIVLVGALFANHYNNRKGS